MSKNKSKPTPEYLLTLTERCQQYIHGLEAEIEQLRPLRDALGRLAKEFNALRDAATVVPDLCEENPQKNKLMKYNFAAPRSQPHRTIYDAFHREAAKRKGRSNDEWMTAECEAVWRAARDYAQKHGMRVPTMDEVLLAGELASGHIAYGTKSSHIAYGAKWACGVAEVMTKERDK